MYIIIGFGVTLILAIVILMVLVLVKPDIFNKGKDPNGEIITADNKVYNQESQYLGDTKKFNPVKSYEDYALDLGNYSYRAIIEVSSVNYGLMSDIEQDMIEETYQGFLNSISFPIELYIQTREIDSDLVINNTYENIVKAVKKFPGIRDYGADYLEEIKNIKHYIGNSKIKKKFVIVPFGSNDLSDVSELTSYEIKMFALEELYNRCAIVVSGLNGVGLKATMLGKEEIAECLYSYYHRDYYRIARDILSGEFNTLAVDSVTGSDKTPRKTLDTILLQCQNQIKSLINSDSGIEETNFYNYIYSTLEYFKQDDRSSSVADLMNRYENEAVDNGYYGEFYDFIEQNPNSQYSNFDQENTNNISERYFSNSNNV